MVESPSGDGNIINFRSGAEEKSKFADAPWRQFSQGHIVNPSGRKNAETVLTDKMITVR
jgi:hypothetical protein